MMAGKRPGRKPVYEYRGEVASQIITIRIPQHALKKLDSMIHKGIFPNRSRAVYQLIIDANEGVLKEVSALRKEKELLSAEIEALRKRLEIVEQEKLDAQAQAEEWERRYRELEAKLAQTFGSSGESKKKGETVSVVDELEKLDVVELAREYYKLREALHRSPGNFYIFLAEERLKRSDAEKRLEELRNRINQVLNLKGVPKPAAWKFINKGDFDKLREVVG